MANIYKRWLCEESLKTPSSRPILIYFEFRSKPSLITVISMDPRPTNYLPQNIVFSYPEMIPVSFSLFLSLSVFCYFTSCSGMFRVPGFIDARADAHVHLDLPCGIPKSDLRSSKGRRQRLQAQQTVTQLSDCTVLVHIFPLLPACDGSETKW